ncbi:TPA: fimbrial protein [Proteus mirabilis]|uniref:fimbrial protein n=1 Tax=Proteus mirabilis TaxID=584 RepID=UPI0018C5308E|nr:fimbrial protein [Proteus mirabilis]HEJ9413232.1 fimbrial protein [Proteus mirabilis]HEJ9437839.1 fimbrial protein [Proteus mirabilis]HEJ9661261.1 fimbrial protein [Proteus mirabilis]
MFKKSLLAVSLLALSSSVAFAAAPTAKLKVTGTIQPPTCTINGETSETTVEYKFDVSPGLFPAKGNLTLEPISHNITVTCDARTYLAFVPTDDRAGSELEESAANFGLGTYQTKGDNEEAVDTKIGFYGITMKNATVKPTADDEETKVSVLYNGSVNSTQNLQKEKAFAWARTSTEFSAGEVFAADFEVKPTINSELKNSDGDAKLDGLATLSFQFGI